MDFSDKKTPHANVASSQSEERLEDQFLFWFHSEFEPMVVSDYAKVLSKFSSSLGQYDVSCENKIRNIARGYKRDIRFKLMQLYAAPFGLPFTQTFAMQLMKKLFDEKACSVSVNKAFACKDRTSKEPRVRFQPVIESVDAGVKAFYGKLYADACDELDMWLKECKSARPNPAKQARPQEQGAVTSSQKFGSIIKAAIENAPFRAIQKKKPPEGASSQAQFQLF